MVRLFDWLDLFISSSGFNCFLYSIVLLFIGVSIGIGIGSWQGGKHVDEGTD